MPGNSVNNLLTSLVFLLPSISISHMMQLSRYSTSTYCINPHGNSPPIKPHNHIDQWILRSTCFCAVVCTYSGVHSIINDGGGLGSTLRFVVIFGPVAFRVAGDLSICIWRFVVYGICMWLSISIVNVFQLIMRSLDHVMVIICSFPLIMEFAFVAD